MVHWISLIPVDSFREHGFTSLPHMIPSAKSFASSSAIASWQVSGTETPFRKKKNMLGRFALLGRFAQKNVALSERWSLTKKIKKKSEFRMAQVCILHHTTMIYNNYIQILHNKLAKTMKRLVSCQRFHQNRIYPVTLQEIEEVAATLISKISGRLQTFPAWCLFVERPTFCASFLVHPSSS